MSKRGAAVLPQARPNPAASENAGPSNLRHQSSHSDVENPAVSHGHAVLPLLTSALGVPSQMHNVPVQPSGIASNPNSYQFSGQVDNIDERDADDPLCATDYVQEMYQHFRQKELQTSVRPVYMETQTHINERMRSILVDWLVEVHLKFKLVPETLYLTINLIDRYLERREVSRPKLQLVGVTCLLIASKYEEIYPPELRDLVYICDRAYSKQEVNNVCFVRRVSACPFLLPKKLIFSLLYFPSNS